MLKNISVSFAATITIQLVTMLGGILSARLLLPEGKGEFTTVLLWPSLIVTLGSLGISDAVAFHAAHDSEDNPQKILASGILLALGLSAGLMLIGYLIIPLLLASSSSQVINTSLFFLWHIPVTLVTLVLVGSISGKLKMTEYNVVRTSVFIGDVVGILILVGLNQVSVPNFALVYLLASGFTLCLALAYAIRWQWLAISPSWTLVRQLLGYGWRVHIGTIASTFNLRLDQMLLSIFLAPMVLGLYVIAVTTSAVANLGAITIGMVAFPHIANLADQQAKALAWGRLMRLAFLITIISVALLFFLAPWIIGFFFGEAYLPAVTAARVLIIAVIPLAGNTIFANGFKAFNRPLVPSQAELIGLGVTVIALTALLPIYQALGAAWASLLAYTTTFIYNAWRAQVELHIPLQSLLRPTYDDWNWIKNTAIRIWNRSRMNVPYAN